MSTGRTKVRLLAICAFVAVTPWIAQRASMVWAVDGGDTPIAPSEVKPKIRREGTQLRDEPGRFLVSGNRVAFTASDGTNYVGLENLNLERVVKVVASSPEAVDWFASGTVTEYQGSNYLLLSHARRKVTKPKAPRGF
jgi:hypothetical protein